MCRSLEMQLYSSHRDYYNLYQFLSSHSKLTDFIADLLVSYRHPKHCISGNYFFLVYWMVWKVYHLLLGEAYSSAEGAAQPCITSR